MKKGTVKFYNETKGFGFIKDADSEKEYYVNATETKDQIKKDDTVTFDQEENEKGLIAFKVKLFKEI
jgi:CspA family cold shock protein